MNATVNTKTSLKAEAERMKREQAILDKYPPNIQMALRLLAAVVRRKVEQGKACAGK